MLHRPLSLPSQQMTALPRRMLQRVDEIALRHAELEQRLQEMEGLLQDNVILRQERDAALARVAATTAEIAALRASTSWKVTQPLRAAAVRGRRLRAAWRLALSAEVPKKSS